LAKLIPNLSGLFLVVQEAIGPEFFYSFLEPRVVFLKMNLYLEQKPDFPFEIFISSLCTIILCDPNFVGAKDHVLKSWNMACV